MTKKILTQERLKELLRYDPETGLFNWMAGSAKHRWVGRESGTKNNKGHFQILVDKTLYQNHRLAWLYMTGAWPKNEIDHIDGNRANNRWQNLRDVCRKTNQQNIRKPLSNNTSGYLGVSWRKDIKKWESKIQLNKKLSILGCLSLQKKRTKFILRLNENFMKDAHFERRSTYGV